MNIRIKLADLREGQVIFADGEDHCLPRGYAPVFKGKEGLCVLCLGGEHYLNAVVGSDGYLIGFTWNQPPD